VVVRVRVTAGEAVAVSRLDGGEEEGEDEKECEEVGEVQHGVDGSRGCRCWWLDG
jgi:hypothetical protein